MALLIPEAHAVTLNAGDIVKPNASANGYYVINNTITLTQLDVNSTDALFTGLDSAWEVTDKTLTKTPPNLVLPQTSTIKNVTLFNFSSFNLTATSVSLYSTVGLVASGNWAQITSSTTTSIKFNSSQNYTGTNWQISSIGDLTGKTWKYKAHNDNAWTTVPAANITFNGSHTLFNLVGINVSASSNSNELATPDLVEINTTAGGGCPTNYTDYGSYCEIMESTTSYWKYSYVEFINVTNNASGTVNLTYASPIGRYRSIGNGYSFNLTENSNSTGLFYTTNSTNLIRYINTTHNSGTSLNAGNYSIYFDFKVPSAQVPTGGESPSSGESTGGSNDIVNQSLNQSANNSVQNNTALPQNISIKGGIQNITKPLILVNPEKIVMDATKDTWIKATVELKNVDNITHTLTLSSSNSYFLYSEMYDIPMSTITLAPNETRSIIVSVFVKTNDTIVFNVLENNVAVGRFYIYPVVKDGLVSDLFSKIARKLTYHLDFSKDALQRFSMDSEGVTIKSLINFSFPALGALIFTAFIALIALILKVSMKSLYETNKLFYIMVVLGISVLVLMV